MSKIVILSERLPYPPTSGTKNLLYNYCRILHDDLGMEVVNISFLEQDDDVSIKPSFIAKTYPLPQPSGKSKIKNLLIKTLLERKYPLQVSLFWDKKIKIIIDKILEEEKPDYVIADFIRTTEYLKDYNKCFKIADLQDMLSLRYQRQLKVDLATINPYGAYLYRLPIMAQRLLQFTWIKKFVMHQESELLRKFELNVGKQYDRVMFVAKSEGAKYDELVGRQKALVAPLGVDYEYFSQKIEVEKIPKSIAFMGALNVAHNENGIIHFIEKIMPLVLERIPNAKLYIIGGGATDKVKNRMSENVILTGRVEDVRKAIGACEVFICPLQFGSGIKTKNLEAMAMGMPVVTTPIGAENIDAENGRDWIVADTDVAFAAAVSDLLVADSEARIDMGNQAKLFIEKNFTWDRAAKAFSEVMK